MFKHVCVCVSVCVQKGSFECGHVVVWVCGLEFGPVWLCVCVWWVGRVSYCVAPVEGSMVG